MCTPLEEYFPVRETAAPNTIVSPSTFEKAEEIVANVITIADNTWASFLYCNPFKLGINIVIEAATKYINGHSDILLGIISSDKITSKKIRIYTKTLGISPGSEEVYLALRGLPTLKTRIKEIEENALKLTRELSRNTKIKKRKIDTTDGLTLVMYNLIHI